MSDNWIALVGLAVLLIGVYGKMFYDIYQERKK
jgi:hypothetical protein